MTGASGFLGSHTARRLVADGHEVIGLAREFPDGWEPGARAVRAGVTDAPEMRAAVEGCDAVVHLAALLPQRRRPSDEMRAVNVNGTRVVVEAAQAAGVRRLVFCSSAEVYGVPAVTPMPEDGPLAPNGEYGRNKVEAEQIVRASGLAWVILRPPTIVGPGMPEPALTDTLRAARAGKPVVVPGGRTRFQMVHVDDVVEAVVLALTRDAAVGGVFNVGADDVPTGRALAESIVHAMGSTSRIVCVPAWLAKPALRLLARFGRPLLEPEHIAIAFADYRFDTTRAKQVLGWQPRHTQAEGFVAMQVRRVPTGDVTLEIAEAGPGGRPLLLVHGFTGAKADFEPFLEPLADRGWHAVAPDLRGHGASDHPAGEDAYDLPIFAADLVALADALGWDEFALLGLSLGGMIAQVLALEHPGRVTALVLMDTTPGPVDLDPDVIEAARATVREHGLAALLDGLRADRDQDPMMTPAARRVMRERPDYVAECDRRFLASSRDMWLSMSAKLMAQRDRSARLAMLDLPTLVLVGEQDPMVPACARIAHAIPGAKLVIVPDAGHSPHVENPDAWWGSLTEFLEGVQRRESGQR